MTARRMAADNEPAGQMAAGRKKDLTKKKMADIIRSQNTRECVDGKKYLCLKADRELPVGERREKDLGNIPPGAAGLKEKSRLCRQAPISAGVLMDTQQAAEREFCGK